jgi:hypothetical protein
MPFLQTTEKVIIYLKTIKLCGITVELVEDSAFDGVWESF